MEPVLFLYMFGVYLGLGLNEQYIFNLYGRQEFAKSSNYTGVWNGSCINAEVLDDNLGNDTGRLVETKTSYLNLYMGITGQLPSVFAALFYGPLSDRIGRKPVILIIAISGCLTSVLTLLLVYMEWSLMAFIAIVAVNGLAGGIPGMLTALYSYIADVSSRKWLTLRLGVLESMIFISGMLALVIAGQWLEVTNCQFSEPYYIPLHGS